MLRMLLRSNGVAGVAVMRQRRIVDRKDSFVAGAQTNIGTGLLSNSRRNEASRCFISVMSTRRPILPPWAVRRSSIRITGRR